MLYFRQFFRIDICRYINFIIPVKIATRTLEVLAVGTLNVEILKIKISPRLKPIYRDNEMSHILGIPIYFILEKSRCEV